MLNANDTASATTDAAQIPFTPQKIGNIITATAWHKNVLKKDIIKDNAPLESAVKKEEAKMFKPQIKKLNA